MSKKEESKDIVIRNDRQLQCFKMKFKGFTYEQMEEKTGYKSRTLELYFCKGGRWHDAYISWREWQTEQIKETMNDMFIAQSIEANQQIVNLSKGKIFISIPGPDGKDQLVPLTVKPDVVLNASKDILDRAGFKPAEKIESKTPDDIAEKITEFFEEKGKTEIAEKKKKPKKNE